MSVPVANRTRPLLGWAPVYHWLTRLVMTAVLPPVVDGVIVPSVVAL